MRFLAAVAALLVSTSACVTDSDCSGSGICDSFGLCACFPGKTGAACDTEPACATIDPVVGTYSLFLFEDYTVLEGSQVTGLAAVGGNAYMTNFSIGDWYPRAPEAYPFPPQSVRNDFIIDGVMSFVSGAVNSGGNLVYGSTAFDTTRVSMAGAGQKIQGHVIDFAARRTATRQLQAYLYSMQASGTYDQDDYGATALISSSTNAVFFVPAAVLSAARSLEVIVPADATVLINVVGAGSTVSMANFAMFGYFTATSAARVLWNFYNIPSIYFSNIQIIGTVLAADSAITFPTGTIAGAVIGGSFTGRGDVQSVPFTGCVLTPPSPSATPSVTPTVSETAFASETRTSSASLSASSTASVSATASISFSATASVSLTPSPSRSAAPSLTASATQSFNVALLRCDASILPASVTVSTQFLSGFASVGATVQLSCADAAHVIADSVSVAAPVSWTCKQILQSAVWVPTAWSTQANTAVPTVSSLQCVSSGGARCRALDALDAGALHYSSDVLTPGTSVSAACNTGFYLTIDAHSDSSAFTAATLTCRADGSWSLPSPFDPLPAGTTSAGLRCVYSASSNVAVAADQVSTCTRKSDTNSHAGYVLAVAACALVTLIVCGSVAIDVYQKGSVAARLTSALRVRRFVDDAPAFMTLPVVLWMAADAAFRAAAFTVTEMRTAGGLYTFLYWFLWTSPLTVVLLSAFVMLIVVAAIWTKFGWPLANGSAAALHNLSQVLPSLQHTDDDNVPTWKHAIVCVGKATAGVLLLPFAYVLLQPWLCPFTSSGLSFVTGECGSALQCGSPLHIITLAVSVVLLAAYFVTLLKSHFALEDMRQWTLPHFLTITLSGRMFIAMSARILPAFSNCASVFTSLFLNIVLTVAAVVYAIVNRNNLPTRLLAAGGVCEGSVLLFGVVSTGIVYKSSTSCSGSLAAFMVALVVLAITVALGVRAWNNKFNSVVPLKAPTSPAAAHAVFGRTESPISDEVHEEGAKVDARRKASITSAATIVVVQEDGRIIPHTRSSAAVLPIFVQPARTRRDSHASDCSELDQDKSEVDVTEEAMQAEQALNSHVDCHRVHTALLGAGDTDVTIAADSLAPAVMAGVCDFATTQQTQHASSVHRAMLGSGDVDVIREEELAAAQSSKGISVAEAVSIYQAVVEARARVMGPQLGAGELMNSDEVDVIVAALSLLAAEPIASVSAPAAVAVDDNTAIRNDVESAMDDILSSVMTSPTMQRVIHRQSGFDGGETDVSMLEEEIAGPNTADIIGMRRPSSQSYQSAASSDRCASRHSYSSAHGGSVDLDADDAEDVLPTRRASAVTPRRSAHAVAQRRATASAVPTPRGKMLATFPSSSALHAHAEEDIPTLPSVEAEDDNDAFMSSILASIN